MANKEFNEGDVINSLKKKKDLRIEGKTIEEVQGREAKGDVGIGSRGKIDFLTKYKGYWHTYVDTFRNNG